MPGTSRTNSAILTRKRARESEKFCRFSFWVREGSRGLYASKVTALGVSRCRGNSDDAALTLLARALVSLRWAAIVAAPRTEGQNMNARILGLLLAVLGAGEAAAHGGVADLSVYDRTEGRRLAVHWHAGRAYVVGKP